MEEFLINLNSKIKIVYLFNLKLHQEGMTFYIDPGGNYLAL